MEVTQNTRIIRCENTEKLFLFYLKLIFEDLEVRSKQLKNTISLATFQEYTSLPMIISEKIFYLFDNEKRRFISKETFLNGLYDLYCGNLETMIDISFKLLDFSEKNIIRKEDVSLLFYHFHTIENNSPLNDIKEIIDISFKSQDVITYKDYLYSIHCSNCDIFFILSSFICKYKPFHEEPYEFFKSYHAEKFVNRKSKGNFQEYFHPGQVLGKIASPSQKAISYLKENLKWIVDYSSVNDESIKTDSSEDLAFLENFENEVGDAITLFKQYDFQNRTNHKLSIVVGQSMKDFACGCNKNKHKNNNNNNCPNILKSDSAIQALKKSSSLTDVRNSLQKEQPKKCRRKTIQTIKEVNPFEFNSQKFVNKYPELTVLKKRKELYKTYKLMIVRDILFYFKYSKSNRVPILKGVHVLKCSYLEIGSSETIKGKVYGAFNLISDFGFRIHEINFLCQKEAEMLEFIKIVRKEINCRLIQDYYSFGESIGSGNFGELKAAFDKQTGKKVAVKVLTKQGYKGSTFDLARWEVDIFKLLKRADHPNIVKAIDLFETQSHLLLVYEYLSGGNLTNFIMSSSRKSQQPLSYAKIICDILDGVSFLHSFGIVHRDIKANNIMFSVKNDIEKKYSVKIIDFGLSRVIGKHEFLNDSCGSVPYVAPEILLGHNYDHKVDVWSIGVTLYYIIYGSLPFLSSDGTADGMMDKVLKEDYNLLFPTVYDWMLENTLKANPLSRKTIDELIIRDDI